MSNKFSENDLEEVTLTWFEDLGFEVLYGPDIAPGELYAERESYEEVVLWDRLYRVVQELNSNIDEGVIEEALRRLTKIETLSLIDANHEFHDYLVNGIDTEFLREDGTTGTHPVRIVDFENPENNNWLVVNQFTVIEANHNRRPDVMIFLNGLPIGIVELKKPGDEKATIWKGYHQLQTYKAQLPRLFVYNELMVISDGFDARIGTLTSSKERFMPWRTIEGETIETKKIQLETLLRGVFDHRRLLDLVRSFTVFEDDGEKVVKKMAAYHQFHAVQNALRSTIRATAKDGDQRAGVVWHTQGSGKSLTMAFFAGKIIQSEEMGNPTLLILTDRNDLDEQLFGTFSRCHELLRQNPTQATDRENLRELLKVASGGVVFTTIQKFMPSEKGDSFPLLSDRRNIVVIADEAHRSQYDFIDGYARHMRDALPNASFIGFTGTPIAKTDKNTQAVFGNYISVYDIQRAVEDGATVPIYYESRLAKITLKEDEILHLDEDIERVTEGEESDYKESLKTKWSALEALVGTNKRLQLIANDLVTHFEARLEVLEGKAMIVCMSRRICVDLYNAIIDLRPNWHNTDDEKGNIKIVMTGSASDPVEWQQHIRTKNRRKNLAKRMKDPKSSLDLVIVRDMWLTGFDAPSMHTMYIDKPMQGHGLMQAIARVNRVFKDKPGGLVVDYIGLADQLKSALHTYTESGGKGKTALEQEDAVAVMLSKYEICLGIFHGFDWSIWTIGKAKDRLQLLADAQEHILAQDEGRKRLVKAVRDLSKAFALSVPHEESIRIRDDVGFFQEIQGILSKTTSSDKKSSGEMDFAIRQLVSQAVSSDEIIDIFSAAGLNKPEISILSDEFLAEIRGMKHRNLALELLRKLLNDEIKERARHNIVQSRSFAEMLEKSILRYQNRSIETAQIIEELIALAKKMREAANRGERLGLTPDEVAFYDALELNGSAVDVLGDDTLKEIAQELVEIVKKNVSIDWTVKESVRAKLRVIVKRILRKYGYPPDKQEEATKIVLEQAELLSKGWVI